jgi:hypothetical protein
LKVSWYWDLLHLFQITIIFQKKPFSIFGNDFLAKSFSSVINVFQFKLLNKFLLAIFNKSLFTIVIFFLELIYGKQTKVIFHRFPQHCKANNYGKV